MWVILPAYVCLFCVRQMLSAIKAFTAAARLERAGARALQPSEDSVDFMTPAEKKL